MVCFLALVHSVGATVYTSSGNKSWSASGFPSWIVASDTINIINSDTVTIGNDIRIFGQVNVDSLCVISGNRVIKVEGSGSLNNYGTIDISQQIHIDGDVYNYNQMNVLNVHNDGYINNSGEIKLDSAQEFEHHGGEIDGCGTVLTDLFRVYENTTVALNGDNAAYIYCQNFCNTQGLDTPNFNGLLTLTEFLNNSDTTNCKVGNDAELCFSGILPVELLNFTGSSKSDGEIVLQWKTAMESNNKGFEVQRSVDGDSWEYIGFVEGAGNSTSIRSYDFVEHASIYPEAYYRLKQIDFSGYTTLSSILHLTRNTDGVQWILYPNPAKSLLVIQAENSINDHITITSSLGEDITAQVKIIEQSSIGTSELDISDLDVGVYYISLGEVRRKFVKIAE